jgi:hypothetical protein
MRFVLAAVSSLDIAIVPEGAWSRRLQLYVSWRQKWIADGMKWRGARKPPEGWDAVAQLQKAGLA